MSLITRLNAHFVDMHLIYVLILSGLMLGAEHASPIWQWGSILVMMASQYAAYLMFRNRQRYRSIYWSIKEQERELKWLEYHHKGGRLWYSK